METNLSTCDELAAVRRRVAELEAENARLREDGEHYRSLFAAMNEGFVLLEVVLDDVGRPSDLRYIATNVAFAALLGRTPEEMIGRTIRELLFPISPWWIETLVHVALTGDPARFERYGEVTGHQYQVHAWRPRPGQCAVLFRDVSEQKRAEDALRESEVRFRELAAAMPQLVWTARPDGTVDYYNQRYLEFAGISPEGASWEWAPVLHPEHVEPTVQAWQRAVATGTAYEIEHRARRADGSYRWYLSRAVPARDAEGHITKWYGTTTDIHAMKEVEQALRESEERYRTLFESIDEGFCIVEVLFDASGEPVDYRFLEANPAFEGQTGLHDAVGKRMRELEPRHEEHWFETYGRIALTGEPERFRNEAKHLDNRWYDVYAFRVGQPEERKVAILFNDITERRQTEEALRESRERFRSVLENSRDVIYRSNLRTNEYDYLSPSVEALTGYREQEIMSMPRMWARERIHPEDRERFLSGIDALRQCPPGERGEVIEYRWLHRSGEYRWISNSRTLLTDAEGKPLAIVGTMRDVSKRKEIERQLGELNETLEARVAQRTRQLRALAAELEVAEDHERRRLARYLHDDLQQTLAAVTFHLDRIHARALAQENNAELQEPIDMLRKAIQTSRSLTAELSPTILYDTGLEAALHWAGRRMEEQHGLHVIVEAEQLADAPPIPNDVKLLLYQSARELLFNVVKHAHTGEATVSLTRPTSDTVEVLVSDAGQGFDVRWRMSQYPSTGSFGLFSISERMEYIGGAVQIESTPGHGTRVTLVAPLQPLRGPDGGRAGGPALVGAVQEDKAADGCIRILLADDHAIVRKGLLRLLQDQPDLVVVGEAGDGHVAVEMARELHPDVVLMDLAMPNLEGIEATRRIVAECPGVHVIGLSMYDDQEKETRMRQAGATSYIPKGGPPGALFAAIRAGAHS